MEKKLNVFILAAGRGERLRPITDHTPKPLLPIMGKPILQSVLEKVSLLPVCKIGINLHYKKEMIAEWIEHSPFKSDVQLFPEEPVMGTGGALKNAEGFLKDGPFLIHNSDILSNINLEKLFDTHLASGNLVTLAVHDHPEFNSLLIDDKGFLQGISSKKGRTSAFTGIALYSPEFLEFLPVGVSSVVDAWMKAVSAGYRIGIMNVTGAYWSDIGTPASYAEAVFDALREDGETVYIDPLSEGCDKIVMNGYIAVEKKSMLASGVNLRNCILLPGSVTEKNTDYEDCILGPDFRIDLGGVETVRSVGEGGRLLIGTGGSDRKYYRVKNEGRTLVLMQCAEDDPDFQRQIEYTHFFLKHSIPVPELKEVRSEEMTALFEDLGDISLCSWLRCPRSPDEVIEMYKRVIDVLILLHGTATDNVSEFPWLNNRVFGYNDFLWETEYFIERFVKPAIDINLKNNLVLEKEFHNLASKADSFPKTIIHRDFQSQNIMITENRTPRLIDYQGARMGPPAYDLVSILWDPYYRLSDGSREMLIDYYLSGINTAEERFKKAKFIESLLPCRLQRHMQALGAYGFLSAVKGKRYFQKYIPEGVRLLKEDFSLSKDEYPELNDLVMRL